MFYLVRDAMQGDLEFVNYNFWINIAWYMDTNIIIEDYNLDGYII